MKTSELLTVGDTYSRKELEEQFDTSGWGFDTGVFIPHNYDSIWLFVTQTKPADKIPYHDLLRGDILEWDGQLSGRTDAQIINHQEEGNELLLFYRMKKTQHPKYAFCYEGQFEYMDHVSANPAHFILRRVTSLEQVVIDDIESLLVEHELTEGGAKTILASRYERNPKLRAAAIQIHGTQCLACGFDFREMYGPDGEGYIEIHHLNPISADKKVRDVNPETDMVPLCANCHRMIHRRHDHPLSVEKLAEIIERYLH